MYSRGLSMGRCKGENGRFCCNECRIFREGFLDNHLYDDINVHAQS